MRRYVMAILFAAVPAIIGFVIAAMIGGLFLGLIVGTFLGVLGLDVCLRGSDRQSGTEGGEPK